jgi:DNA-binding winged helix-turn-helix (wHTH) protein
LKPEAQTPPRFIVDPREGTVSGPGGSVRLEPKVMEVLAALSSRPGRVISREELLDAAWPDVVVTEHTLSRCVYQLRHALGKIAGEAEGGFNPIETLPKRGYRLVPAVETLAMARPASVPRPGDALPPIPYVVGQWVRGDRFYGRSAQIEEILNGPRNCTWLLGTRRVGKTSLLKQLEYIAEHSPERGYLPVFWDFQGAETAGELHLNFADALLDAEDRLSRAGIAMDAVEAGDLFESLQRLRKNLRDRNLRLLLLCDEVEELINLHESEPSLLRKLRHVMQSGEDIRTVLASTIRLWALADQETDTSPFLHGFTPPTYIARISDDDTRSLIVQDRLGAGDRPSLTEDVIDSVRIHCDNHPYLVQLVCKRFAETGDLCDALEQVATDRMVSYFFSVDFNMLSGLETDIIRATAERPPVSSRSLNDDLPVGRDELEGMLRRLENLGYVRKDGEQGYVLANYFFRRWLGDSRNRKQEEINKPAGPPATDAGTVRTPVDEGGARLSLFTELKRRNVFRVGIAYIVAAWLLLQVGEVTFEFLEIPNWAGRLLIVLLGLGLPVALILAWAFELTPEGVRRDSDVDHSAPAPSRRKFEIVIIVILAAAVVLFAIDRFL